jgi:hypothetical protein
MAKIAIYPRVPRSAATLLPGEFWSIPLSDGSFACGRVIQAAAREPGASRVIFLAGLLDWHAEAVPTAESIAGASCLAQGSTHIKTILETGGQVLGMRPLGLDAIAPIEWRGAKHFPNSFVYLGLEPIRPQAPTDIQLPVKSTWGFMYIRELANHRFLVSNDA